MKNDIIIKTGLTLVFALLMVLSTTQAAFSDSFINENANKSLKNFKFSYTAAAAKNKAGNSLTAAGLTEDSFVNDSVVQALEDFKFGQIFVAEKRFIPKATDRGPYDSFLDESNVRILKNFKCVHRLP